MIALWLCVSSLASAALVKLDTQTGFDSVYLLTKPDSSAITVALTVLAGEVDVEGPEGLSHYLEHLMFWHADNVNGKELHARGGNAWVNGLVTAYYNQAELSELEDMLEFVNRLFSLPDLQLNFMLKERSVVEREYDLRVSENPDWRVYTDIRRKLYDNLPVSRSVIGTPETIQSLTIQQATQFHQRFYYPGNSVLFISGDLGAATATSLIEKHFGTGQETPTSKKAPHAAAWRHVKIADTSDVITEFTNSQVNYERLIYLSLSEWPNPEEPIRNLYTLNMLRSILDSALEGGIAKPLRMDNFVLRSFGVSLRSLLSGYFELELFAEPDKGVTLQQSQEAIESTLEALAAAEIPEATFNRVRGRLFQTEIREARNLNSNYSRMAEQMSSGLTPVTGEQHLDLLRSVSLDDVNELLRALAKPQRRSVAFVKPLGE